MCLPIRWSHPGKRPNSTKRNNAMSRATTPPLPDALRKLGASTARGQKRVSRSNT
jgi:hypothetical protein